VTGTVSFTATPTLSHTPTVTLSPTPTIGQEQFYICKNIFHVSSDGTLCITVATNEYPGELKILIYNTAGEHIRTLVSTYLNQPMQSKTYTWDGLNKYGQQVASGVYLVYLIKPYGRVTQRVAVVR